MIDIAVNPQIAKRDNIITIPLLVRESPGPVRKLTGDFSKAERLMAGLDIYPAK